MKAFLCVCFLLLAGCAATVPQVIDKAVVQPWPEPPAVARPLLTLNDADPDGEIIRSMSLTIIELMRYSRELENDLNGYRHNSDTAK